MKKIILSFVVVLITATSLSAESFGVKTSLEMAQDTVANEGQDDTNSINQREILILVSCKEKALEYAKLTGKDGSKEVKYALTECRKILRQYSSIPDGMKPYEKEVEELKIKEKKENQKINHTFGRGGSGSKELDWDN